MSVPNLKRRRPIRPGLYDSSAAARGGPAKCKRMTRRVSMLTRLGLKGRSLVKARPSAPSRRNRLTTGRQNAKHLIFCNAA
jgi:hypothetical protein